ncbi:unnamed protein product [Closterium sp. NIES-53]
MAALLLHVTPSSPYTIGCAPPNLPVFAAFASIAEPARPTEVAAAALGGCNRLVVVVEVLVRLKELTLEVVQLPVVLQEEVMALGVWRYRSISRSSCSSDSLCGSGFLNNSFAQRVQRALAAMATPTAGRHVATTLDRASIVFKLAYALAPSVDVRITQWHATSASSAISTACASALRLLSRTGVTNDDALLSFTLDSGASQCFFRDHTSLAPLRTHVVVALADPSARSLVARSSTTLPCSADPSGSLTALNIPSFSRNMFVVGHLQELGVTPTFPGHGQFVTCTDSTTEPPLATFLREPVMSSLTTH